MTINEEVFIQILSDHLHRRTTFIGKNVDWNIIQTYSEQHQVDAIVYFQTKKEEFKKDYYATLYNASNREFLLNQLLAEITSEYIIVKGTEVSKLYPVPELRTMGDVDIVVCNREEFNNAFMKLGYSTGVNKKDWEWHYSKFGVNFELHDRLIYRETVNDNIKQIDFFNNLWIYVKENKLDWNFHFIFLIYHIKKHIMNSGVGFRQFLDIAVVMKNINLDWNWINEKLDEIELLPFARVVLSFIKEWFDVEGGLDFSSIEEDFYYEVTRKVFEDGVFGFNNEENKEAMVINETIKLGKFAQIKIFFKRVFPSYEYMCFTPHYTWVKKTKVLLPAAWVYRWFRGLMNFDSRMAFLKSSFVSNGKKEMRKDMYKKWKL